MSSSPSSRRLAVLAVPLVLLLLVGGALVLWLPEPAEPVEPDGPSDRVPLKDEQELVKRSPKANRPAAPSDARSLVLIVLPAVGPEDLEPWGAAWGRSPFVGLLGRGGFVHEPLPARAPSPEGPPAWLDGGAPTLLPEALQQAGWYTYGLSAHPALHTETTIRGFDTWRDPQPTGFALRGRLWASSAVDAAIRMVRGHAEVHPDAPFFLLLVLTDVVEPFRVRPKHVRNAETRFPGADPRRVAQVAVVDRELQHLADALREEGYHEDRDLVIAVLGEPGPDAPANAAHPLVVDGPDLEPAQGQPLGAVSELPGTLLRLVGADPGTRVARSLEAPTEAN